MHTSIDVAESELRRLGMQRNLLEYKLRGVSSPRISISANLGFSLLDKGVSPASTKSHAWNALLISSRPGNVVVPSAGAAKRDSIQDPLFNFRAKYGASKRPVLTPRSLLESPREKKVRAAKNALWSKLDDPWMKKRKDEEQRSSRHSSGVSTSARAPSQQMMPSRRSVSPLLEKAPSFMAKATSLEIILNTPKERGYSEEGPAAQTEQNSTERARVAGSTPEDGIDLSASFGFISPLDGRDTTIGSGKALSPRITSLLDEAGAAKDASTTLCFDATTKRLRPKSIS